MSVIAPANPVSARAALRSLSRSDPRHAMRLRSFNSTIALTTTTVRRFCLAAWVMLCLALPASPGATTHRPPNILVILADDLGRGEYSGFGTKGIRTPNLGRLAAQG